MRFAPQVAGQDAGLPKPTNPGWWGWFGGLAVIPQVFSFFFVFYRAWVVCTGLSEHHPRTTALYRRRDLGRGGVVCCRPRDIFLQSDPGEIDELGPGQGFSIVQVPPLAIRMRPGAVFQKLVETGVVHSVN